VNKILKLLQKLKAVSRKGLKGKGRRKRSGEENI